MLIVKLIVFKNSHASARFVSRSQCPLGALGTTNHDSRRQSCQLDNCPSAVLQLTINTIHSGVKKSLHRNVLACMFAWIARGGLGVKLFSQKG